MKNVFILFVSLYLLTPFVSFSQVGVNTTSPDASSVLHVESTSQGLLIPRMTQAERDAIASPAEGLLVYVTDLDTFSAYEATSASWITFQANDYTGWADYADGTYTSGSPYTLVGGSKVTLPNDAAGGVTSQTPLDITTFYDSVTKTITGRNGDGINIVIEFRVKPTANVATKITIAIDIGGGVGEIYTRDFITSKGLDVEHFYLSSFNAYTLGTWETNGGAVKIITDYEVEIYDIRYIITRTHRAR